MDNAARYESLYEIISSRTVYIQSHGALTVSITEFLVELVTYVFWAHRREGHDALRGALQGHFFALSVSSIPRRTKCGTRIEAYLVFCILWAYKRDDHDGKRGALRGSLRCSLQPVVTVIMDNEAPYDHNFSPV